MKKETFILLFSIIFVVNSYGQCPKAEMYKRKSEKAFNDGNKAMRNNPTLVGANYNSNQMGAPDAYIILSAYEAYVCQCKNQNNGKKATELKNFINREYVQRYASMVSKYGSMPRITSCKGGNSKGKTASLKNSNRNSTNSNPLITNKDISDFLKGNKKEREQVINRIGRKQQINNVSKVFKVNQQDAEIINDAATLVAVGLASLIGPDEKKLKEKMLKLKEYVTSVEQIKKFQNYDGNYTTITPFHYKVDFTDGNWTNTQSEYVNISNVDKRTIEVKIIEKLNNKKLEIDDHHFFIFEHPKLNIGKDFEITFEYGFDKTMSSAKRWREPFVFFISNNNSFKVCPFYITYNSSFTPYANRSAYLKKNNFPIFVKKHYSEEIFCNTFLRTHNITHSSRFSEKLDMHKRYKKWEKLWKVIRRNTKNKKENTWVYNKVKIIKKGENMTLYYYILNKDLKREETKTDEIPYKYIDKNKIFFGVFSESSFAGSTKGIKFRIRNFEIKQ